jgi:hypothetical protein
MATTTAAMPGSFLFRCHLEVLVNKDEDQSLTSGIMQANNVDERDSPQRTIRRSPNSITNYIRLMEQKNQNFNRVKTVTQRMRIHNLE